MEDTDIVLSDQNKSLIDEILQEHHRQSGLRAMTSPRIDCCFVVSVGRE